MRLIMTRRDLSPASYDKEFEKIRHTDLVGSRKPIELAEVVLFMENDGRIKDLKHRYKESRKYSVYANLATWYHANKKYDRLRASKVWVKNLSPSYKIPSWRNKVAKPNVEEV